MNLRPRAAWASLPLALAITAALLTPAPAQAATTVGQTSAPNAMCTGTPDAELFTASRSNGKSNTIPHDGVITSWSFQSGASPLQLVLRVFRPAAAADSWTVVGDGGELRTFSSAGLHSFPARVPVRGGDIAGIRITGSGACGNQTGDSLDVYRTRNGVQTPVGGTATFLTSTTVRIDISATLEPDVDRDGYGDETQDLCPQLAGVMVPCVPDTAITKKPKRHAQSPKSKLTFTSTIAGSAFSCTLDKRRPRSCASPEKYRCLGAGKHTYSVVAVSPYGLVDPTPAAVRFRVARYRPRC